MSESTMPLTQGEQLALKKAAFGAVQLISLVHPGVLGVSAVKENVAGAIVLSSATGVVGHVLTDHKDKVKLKGSAANIADEVLPTLTATVETLKAKVPAEANGFRRLVANGVDRAARSTEHGQISPEEADMIAKITAALGTLSWTAERASP